MKYQKCIHAQTRTAVYPTVVPGASLHVRHDVEYGNPKFSVSLRADATGEVACHASVFGSAVRDVFVLAPGAFSETHASLVIDGSFYVLGIEDGMQLAADFQLMTHKPAWAQAAPSPAKLSSPAAE